jgi:hypothetical protein
MMFEAAAWREEQNRKRDTTLAWQIAALARSKKMPTLRELLVPGHTKTMTPEEKAKRAREHEEMVTRMRAKNCGR